jgi:ATP-dependent Lon protease
LSGVQSFGRGWLRLQIEQLDNRIETLEEMLQTQEQMYLESQMKQMEEEKLREEAERLVNLKQELEQKYPPDVAQQILTEMRRLQAVKMAQKNYYNP